MKTTNAQLRRLIREFYLDGDKIYGVDMYDHVWNNYPGLLARRPGGEI